MNKIIQSNYSIIFSFVLLLCAKQGNAQQPFISIPEQTTTLYINYPMIIHAAYQGKEKNCRLVGKNIEVIKINSKEVSSEIDYSNTYCVTPNGTTPAFLAYVNAKGDTLDKKQFRITEVPDMKARFNKGSDKIWVIFEDGLPLLGTAEVLSWKIGFEGSNQTFVGKGAEIYESALEFIRNCPSGTVMVIEAEYIPKFLCPMAKKEMVLPAKTTPISKTKL